MSAAPLGSSSLHDEHKPASPTPPCRPWKYLEHPDADEWTRGPLDVHQYPNLGDFVVLVIDPAASVAHLDSAAKQAARRVPARKYVALCLETTGLPIHTKPTHPYDFLFVRKGRPQPRLPGIDSADSCIAILPNDMIVLDRLPVTPAHPLPWSDCYIDATWGFPCGCRVTSTDRDYVPVLPILDTELMRIEEILQDFWTLHHDRKEQGVDWPDPFDLVSLPALPTSDAHDNDTKASAFTQPAGQSLQAVLPLRSETDAGQGVDTQADEISIIESDDGSQDVRVAPETGDDKDLDMFLAFESMMKNEGDLRDPVVNVTYDLDVITEIVDPIHFLEDVKRLRIIIEEAEIRLGLRPDPTAAERDSLRTSAHEDADSQRSVALSPGVAASRDNATDPSKGIAKSAKGLRARFGSASSRLLFRARTFVRKLAFIRCKKSRHSGPEL
ncbi:hypothetical protein PENSPDRAFT_753204 [Peniophora sp. CONT]|nr:hypothetical protein PENSPDRAFT_753204 [Peniophora sp. CONT]